MVTLVGTRIAHFFGKYNRCRYCVSFADSYNGVAAAFHSSPQEGIRVAKVDCQAERALMARFGIDSFPSFYVVDGWSVYKFEETRGEAALLDFARGGYKKQQVNHSLSPTKKLQTLLPIFLTFWKIFIKLFPLAHDVFTLSL